MKTNEFWAVKLKNGTFAGHWATGYKTPYMTDKRKNAEMYLRKNERTVKVKLVEVEE